MSYTKTPANSSSSNPPPPYRQSSSGPGPSTATRQARVRSHNARQTETEPLERFFVTGQPTGRSPAATARQLDAWDARWADASRR